MSRRPSKKHLRASSMMSDSPSLSRMASDIKQLKRLSRLSLVSERGDERVHGEGSVRDGGHVLIGGLVLDMPQRRTGTTEASDGCAQQTIRAKAEQAHLRSSRPGHQVFFVLLWTILCI